MMKKNLFLTIFVWFLMSVNAFAVIDVVYPKTNYYKTYTPNVFFLGNTTKGADFTINSEKVKLWDDNFFVHVVPLNYGKNTIKMVSVKNGKTEQKTYIVERPRPQKEIAVSNKKKPSYKTLVGELYYTTTIKNNATVRAVPNSSSERITDLPKGVILYLSGKQGDWYRIAESGDSQYWIHKSNLKEPVIIQNKIPASINQISTTEDDKYKYVKILLSYPVLYDLKQEENNLELTLHGVKSGSSVRNYIYNYSQDTPLLGYDVSYDENTLVFKVAKTPKINDKNHPLKDVTIFVDAGHGGSEKGAIGPTRIYEKDINLAISKYLVKYLQEEGANVIVSRNTDKNVELYDRVKMAKDNNALISISIHNNALPDGKDPYRKHGTEVHYYNENAKMLAETIQKDLVTNLYFQDNGIHKSSFALNRSTGPVSVLVECAYMINPEEYMRIRNKVVQRQIAKSIKNSLKKYIINIQN